MLLNISDLDTFNKVVPGHESCGVVHSVGVRAGDCGLKVGDKVLVHPWLGCGKCSDCLAGDFPVCDNNARGSTEIGQGPTTPGGYGEYIPIPNYRHAVKLPDNVSPEMGCMLPCSTLTTYNALGHIKDAVTRATKVRGKVNILLLGLGGLGIWCLKLSRKVYPNANLDITVGDISDQKVQQAKEFGANTGVSWKKTDAVAETIKKLTLNGERKFDACIDFVGMTSTAEIAFGSVAKAATLVFIGLGGGQIHVPVTAVVSKSLHVQGMRVGNIKELEEVAKLVSESGGSITPPPMEFFSLDDINVAIDKLKEGKIAGRAIIKYSS